MTVFDACFYSTSLWNSLLCDVIERHLLVSIARRLDEHVLNAYIQDITIPQEIMSYSMHGLPKSHERMSNKEDI
jgi:hypothetical protein